VRAGKNQVLDVLANDSQSGNILIIGQPFCGTVRAGENSTLEFIESESCSRDIKFSYCIPSEGDCEAFEVTLNVINIPNATPATETPVNVPETEVAVITAPAAATPVATAPVTTTSEPTTYTQGDRLTAGQILLTDDRNDVTVAGFGAQSGPSLFAPDMEELTQPQETVATLRRSVEVVAPSRIVQDYNIQIQTSAATPKRVETGARTQQDSIPLGTESSPVVAFFTPSQPQLTRSSGLVPLQFTPEILSIVDQGLVVTSNSPTQVASTNSDDDSGIQTPAVSTTRTTVSTTTVMVEPSSIDPVNTDTTTAPIGNVLVALSTETAETIDNSESSAAVDNLANSFAPTVASAPIVRATLSGTFVAQAPVVSSTAPAGIVFEDPPLIDELVASLTADYSYLAAVTPASDALEIQVETDIIAGLENQTASVGPVSINAADPADSSDIVVEMAAQILLPAPQLNNSSTRFIKPTPTTEALLSDKLFAADLETSKPPSADPVEIV
jgi:hypothetical protein